MRKSFFLLVAMVFGQLVFGQHKPYRVTWGDEERDSRKVTLRDVLGSDESGIYILKTKTKRKGIDSEVVIARYDDQMNMEKSVEVDLGAGEKDRTFAFSKNLDGNIFLFTGFPDKKSDRNRLFVQQLNKQTLLPEGKSREIASFEMGGGWVSRDEGDYKIRQSLDKSKVLIYYRIPTKKKELERFGFVILDSGMQPVWGDEVSVPFEEGLFDLEDFAVDNHGKAYILGRVFNEKHKSVRKGEPNYSYRILTYVEKGLKPRVNRVQLPGQFITNMRIAVTTDRQIFCVGYYSDLGTMRAKGAYFMIMDGQTDEVLKESKEDFSIGLITQFESKRTKKKAKRRDAKGKDVEMTNHVVREIVLRDDGGIVMVGEQYRVEVIRVVLQNGGTRNEYHYYYGDLLITNVDHNGNIEWIKKIPKYQHTINDYGFYSSYALSVVQSSLFFLFNDHPENLMYDGEGRPKRFSGSKKSLAVMVEMDASGKQSKTPIFSNRAHDILARPKACEQVNEGQLIIFGQRGRSQRLALLAFRGV